MSTSWMGTTAIAIQASSGVLDEEIDERRSSHRDVHDERVAHVFEERLDAVHVEGHLVGERARAPRGEERDRQALHLVDDEAAQARDRGPHEALRVDVRREREGSVDGQEREVRERVVGDEVEAVRRKDAVDEVPEAGRERDVRDRLQRLPDRAQRDDLRLDAKEHPQAVEGAPVPCPRERDEARSGHEARGCVRGQRGAVFATCRHVREAGVRASVGGPRWRARGRRRIRVVHGAG